MSNRCTSHSQRPLPELAKKVWQAQKSLSARSVAHALTQAGRPVHYTTVSRWRRNGWRADPTGHPFERARADLEVALPLVTGNPTSTIEDLIRAAADGEQLSDRELLQKSSREVARAINVVCQAVMHRPDLVATSPGELGVLMRSLAACMQAVTAGFAQAEKMDGTDPKASKPSTGGEHKVHPTLADALRPIRDRAPALDPGGRPE